MIAGTTSLDGFVADQNGGVDRVPIFVLTHHAPRVVPKQDERLTFTFVAEGVE